MRNFKSNKTMEHDYEDAKVLIESSYIVNGW